MISSLEIHRKANGKYEVTAWIDRRVVRIIYDEMPDLRKVNSDVYRKYEGVSV